MRETVTVKSLSWQVEGRSGEYTVTLTLDCGGIWTCTCPSQQYRGTLCRHCLAVSMLQRLALLDKEAVEILEGLAKKTQLQLESKPKPMSVKEKLDAVFGE